MYSMTSVMVCTQLDPSTGMPDAVSCLTVFRTRDSRLAGFHVWLWSGQFLVLREGQSQLRKSSTLHMTRSLRT
jgi:hypothetical protein